MRPRLLLLPLVAALVAIAAGCGGRFQLPTEQRISRVIPRDSSYSMLATWTGMTGIHDVLVTQGPGSQLFLLFNTGGNGPPSVPRGHVDLYPFSQPRPIGPPYFQPLRTLFNPIALTAAQGRLFVLDQGDSCLAHYDSTRGTCEANTTPFADNHIPFSHLPACWHVREYDAGGGDTLSTFTDTTFAQVYGIAADDNGFVYVSGIAIVLDTLQTDQRIRTRKFVSRIYRYARGKLYPGVVHEPYDYDDVNMPTSPWHRDTSWVVFDGSGASSVSDPRGLRLSRYGTPTLFVADQGNAAVKQVSVNAIGVGYVKVDGSETGVAFNQPSNVAADLAGFFYVVDRGNRRVLRYDASGGFVQVVNVEPDQAGQALLDPVAVGVDDSVAYVADAGRAEVLRFKRRK